MRKYIILSLIPLPSILYQQIFLFCVHSSDGKMTTNSNIFSVFLIIFMIINFIYLRKNELIENKETKQFEFISPMQDKLNLVIFEINIIATILNIAFFNIYLFVVLYMLAIPITAPIAIVVWILQFIRLFKKQ